MNRFIIEPHEIIEFDFLKDSVWTGSSFKTFKNFDRYIFRYDKGKSVWWWVYPDGHKEVLFKPVPCRVNHEGK